MGGTSRSHFSVDHMRSTDADEFAMSAEGMFGGIVDQTSGHWVEVNIGHDLPKVLLGVDHSGPITALPQTTESSMATVVVA